MFELKDFIIRTPEKSNGWYENAVYQDIPPDADRISVPMYKIGIASDKATYLGTHELAPCVGAAIVLTDADKTVHRALAHIEISNSNNNVDEIIEQLYDFVSSVNAIDAHCGFATSMSYSRATYRDGSKDCAKQRCDEQRLRILMNGIFPSHLKTSKTDFATNLNISAKVIQIHPSGKIIIPGMQKTELRTNEIKEIRSRRNTGIYDFGI